MYQVHLVKSDKRHKDSLIDRCILLGGSNSSIVIYNTTYTWQAYSYGYTVHWHMMGWKEKQGRKLEHLQPLV